MKMFSSVRATDMATAIITKNRNLFIAGFHLRARSDMLARAGRKMAERFRSTEILFGSD